MPGEGGFWHPTPPPHPYSHAPSLLSLLSPLPSATPFNTHTPHTPHPQEETARGKRFLRIEMGLNLKRNEESSRVSITFDPEEVASLSSQFQSIDAKRTGYITLSELKRSLVVGSPVIPMAPAAHNYTK